MPVEHSNARIAGVLERVADAWESGKLGWCQGRSFQYKNSRYEVSEENVVAACSMGAIMLEVGILNYFLRREVIGALREHLGDPTDLWSVSTWNDEPGRTKQQVIDVFKETAKDLRNANNEVL